MNSEQEEEKIEDNQDKPPLWHKLFATASITLSIALPFSVIIVSSMYWGAPWWVVIVVIVYLMLVFVVTCFIIQKIGKKLDPDWPDAKDILGVLNIKW